MADLGKFDTREKASAGVLFPLVIGGETVVGDDGKPVTFKIRGMDDEDVNRHFLGQSDAKASTPEEVTKRDIELAKVCIAGWSDNFDVGGKRLKYSKDAIEEVFSIPAVRKALLLHILDERAFMSGS